MRVIDQPLNAVLVSPTSAWSPGFHPKYQVPPPPAPTEPQAVATVDHDRAQRLAPATVAESPYAAPGSPATVPSVTMQILIALRTLAVVVGGTIAVMAVLVFGLALVGGCG